MGSETGVSLYNTIQCLPPVIFLQFVLVTTHIITHAEHEIPRQRGGCGIEDIVLRAALDDIDTLIEQVERCKAHFHTVVFAKKSAHRGIPDGCALVKIKTFIFKLF